MTNNYNTIAGIYDLLSKMIYGNAIINAQKFLLQQIPANSNILIVGGGTGKVLEKLSAIHPQNITITYVEKSVKMMALSKKRNCKSNKVEFIHAAIEDYTTDKKFDIVFTAFLFDNFQREKIECIFSKLDEFLKSNGLWLYADFTDNKNEKWWQKFLLKTMYLFFKITCNIEAHRLIKMDNYFAKSYIKTNEAFFFKNFIVAEIYKKSNYCFSKTISGD